MTIENLSDRMIALNIAKEILLYNSKQCGKTVEEISVDVMTLADMLYQWVRIDEFDGSIDISGDFTPN